MPYQYPVSRQVIRHGKSRVRTIKGRS